jgi:hypothetical protein
MPFAIESQKGLSRWLQAGPSMPSANVRALCMACCGFWLLVGGCNPPLFTFRNGLITPANSAPSAGSEQDPSSNTGSAATPAPMPDRATPPRPAIVVTTVTFDVLRVRVPQGLLSRSGKIWNHVDTSFLPDPTVNVLHRNGLRVARGEADAWPPIKAILETEANVETAQSQLSVSNGFPLLLDVDPAPRDQLLFVYRRDGSMAGAPWPSSRNLLRIDYGISPTNSQALLFDVVPAIRPDSPAAYAPRGAERWNLSSILADRTMTIRDLAFRVELAPEQFLAIGPSTATRDLPYVIGSLLLCEEKAGEKFESIYFITPTVTRSGDF